LSSGYGFIEFDTNLECENALKNLQGKLLNEHSLKLSIAKAKNTSNEKLIGNKRKKESKLNDPEHIDDNHENTKIIVKNLAFEATKVDIRTLFKNFGEIKSIRFPVKLDGSHRGFCFVEFLSSDEAKKNI